MEVTSHPARFIKKWDFYGEVLYLRQTNALYYLHEKRYPKYG